MTEPIVTPDGRYIVVRGRRWRRSDPRLGSERHQSLIDELVAARRAVGLALRTDTAAVSDARLAVDAAKVALGERGPVWWKDGAPDVNRHMVANTPYADWFDSL